MNQRAEIQLRHRKIRDRAMVLLLVGVLLLMPPIANIFHLGEKLGGIPVTLVYPFVVWALLIVGAMLLAARLPVRDDTDLRVDETAQGE